MLEASWIDTHAHLCDEELHKELPAILRHSAESNVHGMICVAVDRSTSVQVDTVSRLADNLNIGVKVWGSVGIHPNYAHQELPGDWDAIMTATKGSSIRALGETGLDKYWNDCPFDLQIANFKRHWRVSRELGLPVIIHSRECDSEMLDFLRREYLNGPLSGVMHSFCSTYEFAMECIDMGLHISFSGMLTYKKNDSLREVASRLPLDRLLVETDSPYLSPEPKRAVRRNEPGFVIHTGQVLAQLHSKSSIEMSAITTQNGLKLFNLSSL